ncbi:transposase [Streptomyces roseoverticillatus]|uniref:transposase n=1 Tax=Streptomyces roseoverticillatus TaxID=66429 RepID=UPI0033CB501B
MALRPNKTTSEVGRELEMNPERLRGWVKKHQKRQEPAPRRQHFAVTRIGPERLP